MDDSTIRESYRTSNRRQPLQIPPDILLFAPLSLGAKLLYSRLIQYAQAGATWEQIPSFADSLGMEQDECVEYWKELIESRFVGFHDKYACTVPLTGGWEHSQIILVDKEYFTFYRPSAPEPEPIAHKPSSFKRTPLSGYVYTILATTGHYKIGRTKNLRTRMDLFTVKLPFEFEIIHVFESEDMCAAERELHERFTTQRVNGEWFTLTDDDVTYIKSLS